MIKLSSEDFAKLTIEEKREYLLDCAEEDREELIAHVNSGKLPRMVQAVVCGVLGDVYHRRGVRKDAASKAANTPSGRTH